MSCAPSRHVSPPRRPGGERRRSERRQGLVASQAREYRLRAAAQTAGVGVFDFDYVTGDCYWSAELKDIAGLPADAVVTLERLADILHPDDKDRLMGKISCTLDPGSDGFLEDEHRFLRPDGSVRWVKAMGRSFFAEEGGVRRRVGASGIVMDITGLRATEDALRRSREQLDLAVRGAGIGIWSWNIRTGEVYWSERARQLFGIAGDEHPSLERVLGRLPAGEGPGTAALLQRALQERADYHVENRIVRPDGGEHWVVVLGHGHYDESGEARAMSGIVVDISDRKAAEIALRNRTEALHFALRAGHSGTFEWDAQTRQFEWSDELLALYGLKREDFGGEYEDWLACLLDEDRRIAHEAMERALKEGEYSVYFRIRRKDTGEVRWMNGRGLLSFDGQGKPLRMVGINIDVTEQKRSEEMLRQHVSLLELTHEPIMVWGPHEGMVFWNHGCQILYGYTREEALGRSWRELLKTVYPQPFEAVLAQLESSGHWEGEIRQTTKDGRVLIETCRMQRFRMNGHTLVLAANRDITHRKEMEESLRRMNEDLERKVRIRTAELAASKEALEKSNLALSLSNQELREFAYVAAHDLQTPLRSIAGFARLLQQQYQARLGPEADGWIGLIVDNARRMHTLIRDVLDYSGVESRGEALRPVDLGRVVDDVVGVMTPRMEESKASISRGSLPVVMGDPGQLARLIQNLVDNALTYHGAQPPEIRISASRGEGEWIIAVSDKGIGIDPKHHETIFEAFRRLHTYKEFPGTGVGLSICRRIVHRHGGRIWVQSAPGKGSTFYFSLPDREERRVMLQAPDE